MAGLKIKFDHLAIRMATITTVAAAVEAAAATTDVNPFPTECL